MYNNATSLSTLVNQLLYVQKIEAGMVQLHLSKVEIVALVRKVMASFQQMAEIKVLSMSWTLVYSSLEHLDRCREDRVGIKKFTVECI